MEPKLALRGEQKEERRRRILDAAREIIATRGYQALTMRDLAAGSRVTVPTIYNLVGSKDEVLSAAIADQTAGFVAGIAKARRATPASAIVSVVETSCNELTRLPDYYQSLLRLLLHSKPSAEGVENVNGAIVSSFASALHEMRESGELDEWVDISALAQRLAGHLRITALDWAAGNLDAKALTAASLFGSCMMLLGVASGESLRALRACAEKTQAVRPASPRSKAKTADRAGD